MNCDNLRRWLLYFCCFLLLSSPAVGAQSSSQPPVFRQKRDARAASPQPIPAESELQRRLNRVRQAKSAGDVPAVAQTSGALIALALRELAQLRLLQSASPQAVSLYEQSLKFENLAETRVGLAISLLYANQVEEAIRA